MTRLAIVDDHEALREGLEALLAHDGLEIVGTAGNVAAAVDLLQHARPDVALVDVNLPDGSGIELTRRLLRMRPNLRVLLYTGDTDADLLFEGLESGACGYALKAGPMRELAHAIEQVAAGGTYVDPRLDALLLRARDAGGGAAGRAVADGEAPSLSPREREVMRLMAEGATADVVAGRLGLSVETVRTHVRNAVRKLQARNRVHAIALALVRGEIALGEPAPPPR